MKDRYLIYMFILMGAGDPTNCAYIRLDRPEYSEHHKYPSRKLTKKQKEEFINIMTSNWKKYFVTSVYDEDNVRPATGYDAAVTIWKDTYGETIPFLYDEEGFPIIPDYSKL